MRSGSTCTALPCLAALGVLALASGCPTARPDLLPFDFEGDYVVAYMAEHFEDGGTEHTWL